MKLRIVKLELAQKLKEKGFDWPTLNYYHDPYGLWHDGEGYFSNPDWINKNNKKWDSPYYSAPTLDLASKWFRDERDIIIDVFSWKDHASDVNDPYQWKCFVNGNIVYIHFKTYEEALEAGLKQALTLI